MVTTFLPLNDLKRLIRGGLCMRFSFGIYDGDVDIRPDVPLEEAADSNVASLHTSGGIRGRQVPWFPPNPGEGPRGASPVVQLVADRVMSIPNRVADIATQGVFHGERSLAAVTRGGEVGRGDGISHAHGCAEFLIRKNEVVRRRGKRGEPMPRPLLGGTSLLRWRE